MNKQNILVGLGLLALSGVIFFKPTSVSVNVPQQAAPIVNVQSPEVNVPATVVNVPKQDRSELVGAVATLDRVDNPYVTIGGAQFYYYNRAITATSSTICSLRNPFGTAPASVLDYSASVTTNGLGAQSLTLATSTDQYLASAGPAFLKGASVGASSWGLKWQDTATTTAVAYVWGNDGPQGQSYTFLGSNEYLNLKIGSTTPGTFASYYTGSCSALIKKL